MRMQLTIALLAVAVCGQFAEAKNRRMVQQQPAYTQYYAPTQYYTPAAQPAVAAQPAAVSTTTATTAAPAAPANPIVQTSSVATTTTNTVVHADAGAAALQATAPAAPVSATYGSAQWKAEQSARMGSVAHIGGGFGGGSFEGNGFGFTAQQAIQNCCFWGTRQPLQIGVARGANGYYATVFYR